MLFFIRSLVEAQKRNMSIIESAKTLASDDPNGNDEGEEEDDDGAQEFDEFDDDFVRITIVITLALKMFEQKFLSGAAECPTVLVILMSPKHACLCRCPTGLVILMCPKHACLRRFVEPDFCIWGANGQWLFVQDYHENSHSSADSDITSDPLYKLDVKVQHRLIL